jgi:hypothetical protein
MKRGGTIRRKKPCTRLTKLEGKGINLSYRIIVRDIGITIF